MASDTAISTTINNKHYRIGEGARKLFKFDNFLVFCSGNLELSYKIMDIFSSLSNKSIESLRRIAHCEYTKYSKNDLSLDILVATYENGQSALYQISPYKDFEIDRKVVPMHSLGIWSGGIKTKESYNLVSKHLYMGSKVVDVFQNTFNDLSDETIGGMLELYSVTRKGINLIYLNKIKENEDINRASITDKCSLKLVVAEQIYGQIGAFVKVYANSIIVGPSGEKLPDLVIQSSGYWNSVEGLAKNYTNSKDTSLREDLRLTAPLPTSIAMNSSGITAYTSDNTKFARLDYRGLYVQNGAVQISSSSGTTMITSTGINASAINAGALNGIYLTIGTGNNVVKADGNGLYAGNSVFGNAPFRVNMQGNVVANNITLTGTINSSRMNNSEIVGSTMTIGSGNQVFKADTNGIYLGNASFGSAPFRVDLNGNMIANNGTFKGTINSSTINSTNISGGSITGTSININNRFRVDSSGNMTASNANISGNITMTSGTIQWGSVGAPDYEQINGSKPPTNADNTNLSLPMALGSNYTRIGSTYIYTGTLNANQINAGKIRAEYIETSGLAAERIYKPGTPSSYLSVGGTYSDLNLQWGSNTVFTVYNGADGSIELRTYGRPFLRSRGDSTFALGDWNITAKFA